MKKWPFLLLLPLAVGAGVLSNSRVQARQTLEPSVANQTELDALARQSPTANFNKLGHAFDNSQARLFWNTDFEAAKCQAVREGKPILALRLLGNLSDEYSCANSRFFRVVFYPQAQINERLRRDFVLYWSSERPVPVVTIDMGDGRVLKRTVTGNTAHYLLDANGRPLDVFPGLTIPSAFNSWLESSSKLAQDFKAQPQQAQGQWLAKWHSDQLRETLSQSLNPGGGKPNPTVLDQQVQQALDSNPLESTAPVLSVSARAAAPRAFGKTAVEAPVVGTIDGRQPALPSFFLVDSRNAAPVLDESTRARIRAMNPLPGEQSLLQAPVQNVSLAQTQTTQKNFENDRFQTLIRSFEANLRADTLQNQRISMSIHALFARGHEGDLEALNRRIYDRLFLTPRSDQWLGLTSDTAFSALQNDGVTVPPSSETRLAAN